MTKYSWVRQLGLDWDCHHDSLQEVLTWTRQAGRPSHVRLNCPAACFTMLTATLALSQRHICLTGLVSDVD